MARNFIEDWRGISIDPSEHLGSSLVQSTQNAEEIWSVETGARRIRRRSMQMAMVWAMFNDLGQDCQGLWHCWRHGQWCSNWFGGWICAGACQLGGYWEHDVPPSPDRQVPPFASNASQVSKTPPTPRSAACKKPGVDGKPPQKFVFKKLRRGNFVFKKLRRGQGEQIRWSS